MWPSEPGNDPPMCGYGDCTAPATTQHAIRACPPNTLLVTTPAVLCTCDTHRLDGTETDRGEGA